jgi:hypothetical protein
VDRFSTAADIVPVNVGEAEKTTLPVPVADRAVGVPVDPEVLPSTVAVAIDGRSVNCIAVPVNTPLTIFRKLLIFTLYH